MVYRKYVLYVSLVVFLSITGYLIYDWLDIHRFHNIKVSIFCNEDYENVGIKDTRSLTALKRYIHEPKRFEELEEYKIENFFKDTIHVANCTEAILFSKRYFGARTVKVELADGEETLTVLTEHIRLDQEVSDYH